MKRGNDHVVSQVARIVAGAGVVMVGLLALRSIPDLIRYLKIERM